MRSFRGETSVVEKCLLFSRAKFTAEYAFFKSVSSGYCNTLDCWTSGCRSVLSVRRGCKYWSVKWTPTYARNNPIYSHFTSPPKKLVLSNIYPPWEAQSTSVRKCGFCFYFLLFYLYSKWYFKWFLELVVNVALLNSTSFPATPSYILKLMVDTRGWIQPKVCL